MKDLYRRIGLSSQTDDRATIERALAVESITDAASVRAARHILLDPDRKAVYDRTHAVVRRVGQLRANLGLSRSPNGLMTDCGDFESAPSGARSELHAMRARHSATGPRQYSLGRWVGLSILVLVVGSCIIIGLQTNDPSRT